MSPRQRQAPDPRHAQFRILLEAYWRDEPNELVPDLTWGAAEAGALGAFLRSHPKLSANGMEQLLRNRLASEDHARGEAPRIWLGSLSRYANGPLDRYKLPMRAVSQVAIVGMQQGTPARFDQDAALEYWRIVQTTNPKKFAAEAPAHFKRQLEGNA